MTNRSSRRVIARALLASSLTSLRPIRTISMALMVTGAVMASSAAHAGTVPKFVDTIDDHGVDLVTGLPFVTIQEGAIGSGPGRVSMQRMWSEGAWSDNWTGGLYPITDANNITKMYVQFGGISDSFSGSASTWTADKADGTTLVVNADGTWTYTARDGTRILFDSVVDDGWAPPFVAENCPGADASGCRVPLSITRPNGLKFTLAWQVVDGCAPYPPACYDHRLSSVTSSAGYKLTASYVSDAIGDDNWFKRSAITFTNTANPPSPAPTITYAYPAAATFDVTDPAGRMWEFKIGPLHDRLLSVRRPGSSLPNMTYGYGTDNTVNSATKDGVTNTYVRSLSGTTTATETRTDPASNQRVVISDTSVDRPTSDRDELNRTTSYQYDSNARVTRVTAPEGNYVQYAYDPRGNVTTTTNVPKAGSGLANIVTSASFDTSCSNIVKCNEPNSTTDGKSNVTNYTYDPTHGGLLTITQPAPTTGAVQPQTRYSYTQVTGATGDLVYTLTGVSACQTTSSCAGTSDETKATIAYNSNLLATSVSRGDGTGALTATDAYTYDAAGDLLTDDGPLSGTADTTRYRYDIDQELIGVTSPDPDGTGPLTPRAMRITYRPDGQVSERELGTVTDQSDTAWANFSSAQQILIGFDSNNRPNTQLLQSAGTTYAYTHRDYDALGRIDCTAVRMNPAVYNSLPGACTPSTQGSYGPDQISKNIYDAAGQLTQVQEGVGTADAANDRTLTYNPNGTLASLTDANNNLTSYTYDGFDRPIKTTYPGGSTEQVTLYDANGNAVTALNRASQSFSFNYDALNRVTFKSGAVPQVNYTYDNLDRMLTATFASSGQGITNTYDALGRLKTSSSNMDGTARTMNSQYDAAGDRVTLTGNVGNYQGNYNTSFSYDVLGRMTAFQGWTQIGYDNSGRRSYVNLGSFGSANYGYDAVDRLTSLSHTLAGTTANQTLTIGYSPSSQIATRTSSNDSYAYSGYANVNRGYTANGLNQYTAAGSAGFTYDANGNLTSDGSNTFVYDAENHLTSVSGAHTATLSYDPLGRLWQISAPSGTTRFVYDRDHDVIEMDGNGNGLRAFVWGPGADEPQMSFWESPNPKVMRADERGSIIAVTDGSGNIIATNSYDEYGTPGSSNQGRFQYTGQAWLSEIGLYYYKARMYSPTLGRFMQTDPIGYAAGPNWYAYVQDDPVNATDPLGLDPSIFTGLGPPTCGSACHASLGVVWGPGGQGMITITGSRSQSNFHGAWGFETGGKYLGRSIGVDAVGGGLVSDGTQLRALKPKPAYCRSLTYKIGDWIHWGANGIGYVGAGFDAAALGSFVGSGGVFTPGSAALGGVGVSLGVLASTVGVVGNGLKGLGGDPRAAVSSFIDGLAAAVPAGSPSAKEAFAESVGGFLGEKANDAVSGDPCE